jgi:phytoene synthase
MDLECTQYASLTDLRLYAYRVAGTVALMMTHILGASSVQALPLAAEMGIAMQLTNIARDVKEDLERGRLYLPERWVREVGLDPSELTPEALRDARVRRQLFGAVTRVLDAAEESYRRGFHGLRYLPWHGIFAVAAAARMYRSIGRRILEIGPDALLGRTVVSTGYRLAATIAGVTSALPVFVPRAVSPWAPAHLPAEWRSRS